MIVYVITNLKNGKIYVGQTVKTLVQRWYQHERESRRPEPGMIVAYAIRKHGAENFVIESLATATDQEQLDLLESLWIRVLRSHENGIGYNVKLGTRGHGVFGPETRAKIAASVTEHLRINGHPSKGRVWPEAFIQKLRDLKGPRNARFGKKDSPEVCEKRRQSIIGKHYKHHHDGPRANGGRNNAAGKRSDEVKARMRALRAPFLEEQLLRAKFTRIKKKLPGPLLLQQHAAGNYF